MIAAASMRSVHPGFPREGEIIDEIAAKWSAVAGMVF